MRASMIYRGSIDTSGLNALPQTPEVMEASRMLFNGGEPIRDTETAARLKPYLAVLEKAADRLICGGAG